MTFKRIYLKEGLFERTINFSSSTNLIYSVENSCGKTTLLRFMLYGLGYNIPNTRNIKFDRCEVETEIECEKAGTITLFRSSQISIEVQVDSKKQTFVLPEQQNDLHTLIWGTDNADILNNLLGTYYVDQEKGWTLLNRGVVIGSIHFNIEQLIRGLSGVDCSELIVKEKQLTGDIEKYKQMFSVAKYRESLDKSAESLIDDSYELELDTTLDTLTIERNRIRTELKRVDEILSDNRNFKKFISDMKILVELPNGETLRVTDRNIVGLNDSIDLLISKRKMLSNQLSRVVSQIETLQKEKAKEDSQLAFFQNVPQIAAFDRIISNMPLNPISIKKELDRLEKEAKNIRDEVSRITKENNKVAAIVSKNIIKYATELGIGDKDSIPVSYLFTSNLKELSGAILHKTAFAFRLAYIIAIESVINVKLPIIMDSPTGKEVDPQNVRLMMDILKRDFFDHQIIIASIYKYDFDSPNIIEITKRLIGSE